MEKPPVTKKTLFLTSGLSIVVIVIVFLSNILDTRTKLVFCDVGQGDAAYIRIKNKTDILIDAGPSTKVLTCLGKHMPFYDKTIELVIISHPQKDHYGGLIYILDRYQINTLLTHPINHTTSTFKQLMNKINSKNILVKRPSENQIVNLSGAKLVFLWPPTELGPNTIHDLNELSLIFSYQENKFRALFTGDATPRVLNRLLEKQNIKSDLLKIPHHGSKNGLTSQFLKLADPKLSVISVGKKNSYGHPSREVLDMLKALNKKYLRTDENGDIVIKI